MDYHDQKGEQNILRCNVKDYIQSHLVIYKVLYECFKCIVLN